MTTLFVLDLFISNSPSTHLVWLQRYQLYGKYKIDTDSMKFSTFNVILTLTTAIFTQDSPAYYDVPTY